MSTPASDSKAHRVGRLIGFAIYSVAALSPLAVACSCDTPALPMNRECSAVSTATVTAVELGDTSAPFAASGHAEQVRGGQGLTMLSFRIAVQSTGAPTCIAQETVAGPTTFTRPLAIASHEGDWWVTAPLFVVTSSIAMPVTATVGGMTVTRTMSAASPADAGRDAR